MAENTLNISDAEWEIMRVVWAHQGVTGREIIDAMMAISDWKEGTIKSLINRLQQKEMIQPMAGSKPYQYEATLSEREANYFKGQDLLDKICNKDRGKFLAHFVEGSDLALKDIDLLMEILETKRETAPEEVPCNCPPGQCHCHLQGH